MYMQKFKGWNTLSDGTGSSYSDESAITMGGSYMTLYAQWTINSSYLVTF